MAKSLAQRFLEMLPPRLLSEVVDFITANGYNTSVLVKAGRAAGDSLPVAFWPLDAYKNEQSRQDALTAMSVFVSSLDAQVVYGEETTENYWQILSALRFGSSQDAVFKKQIGVDDDFDATDWQGGDDADAFLDKEQLAVITSSPGYKQASKAAQKAFTENVDFLTELRKYGRAVAEMRERMEDRVGYIGHFDSVVAGTRFGGDVDTAVARDQVRMLAGDILNGSLRSADPAYTGGLGKFFKKALKGIGKVAGFIPGLSGITSLVGGLSSFSRPGRPQPQQPQYAPDAQQPMYSPQQLAPGQFNPDQMPMPAPSNAISLATPEGRVLYGFAKMYLGKAAGTGDISVEPYGSGDILASNDNGGVGAVALPALITPHGDVLENCGDMYIPTDNEYGTGGVGGVRRLALRQRQQARDTSSALINQARACVAQLQQRGFSIPEILSAGDSAIAVAASRGQGDVDNFVGGWLDDINGVLNVVKTGSDIYRDVTGRGVVGPSVTTPLSNEQDAIKRMYDALVGGATTMVPGAGVLTAASSAWASVRAALAGRSKTWRSAPQRILARWDSKPHAQRAKSFLGDTDAPEASGLGDM